MSFKHPTFIVLDLPQHISKKIMKIRKDHKDDFRSALPVEITIAGSSGVGVILENQNEELVYKKIDKIARASSSIKLSFGYVKRFPGTDIFVLKLKDETEVLKLHNKLKDSGIQFGDNPFKFEPHCTLRSRTPISKEDVEDLLKVEVLEEFEVDTLSVYMLDELPIKKLHTVKLSGRKEVD